MFIAIVLAVTLQIGNGRAEAPGTWHSASEAALAAAHRYTIVADMLSNEVGVAIIYDPGKRVYSYSQNLHFGDYAITVDTGDPKDVPAGYEYIGTWHAHAMPGFDGLDGHIATIQQYPSIIIWTSVQGYVVEQFWDAALNLGRGGVHAPVNICPGNGFCVPFP
ncbi:MAG: hypothetical protein M3007_07120 [Candidatus Eremiobacteraeota bacterium]|nr:hypothetical protein [Candidatus Eremiobacteraeota bacterium]